MNNKFNLSNKNKKNENETLINQSISNQPCIMDTDEKKEDYDIDKLHNDIMMLKEINISLKELNPDIEIIKETNKQIHEIEAELLGINEIITTLNGMIIEQGEKLDKAEENVTTTNEIFDDTLVVLDDVIQEVQNANNRYLPIKMIGGAIIGGALF